MDCKVCLLIGANCSLFCSRDIHTHVHKIKPLCLIECPMTHAERPERSHKICGCLCNHHVCCTECMAVQVKSATQTEVIWLQLSVIYPTLIYRYFEAAMHSRNACTGTLLRQEHTRTIQAIICFLSCGSVSVLPWLSFQNRELTAGSLCA
jgi:hypothetical protein